MNSKQISRFLVLFFVVGLFMLSACSSKSDTSAIVVALSGNPSTLDPQATTETLTFQVCKSLYDTLLEPDPKGVLVPALAESWIIAPDQRSITFKLRNGVTFHDGSPFSSRDVKASLERIMDPKTASPSKAEYAVIQSIETPDAQTVILYLRTPSTPLLTTLASGWSAILSADKIAAGFNFATGEAGTGPFKLKTVGMDSRIVMDRNPAYWQIGLPQLHALSFQVVGERTLRVQGLVSGQLDIMDLVNPEDIPTLTAQKKIAIQEDLSSLVMVVAINTSHDILGKLAFRQALNYAVDKQKVIDVAYGGGKIVGTFNDAGNPYYADFSNLFPYDPVKARELVKSSGYTAKRVLDLVLPENFEPHVKAGQIYQEMFKAVGIETKIRLVDWSTWINDVYGKAQYDLTVIGHTGKLDPDGRFQGYGRGGMYVRWTNIKAADLIDQARIIPDGTKREEIYRQIQQEFAQDLPFVFVGTSKRIVAVNDRVTGFIYTPNLDTYDFRHVELK